MRAGQESLGFHPLGLMICDLLVQPRLDRIEQSPIQNCGLLAFEDFAFERDFADVEAIAQKLRQRAPGKRYAANALARLESANLGDDATPAQISHQEIEAAKLEIAADDGADPISLGRPVRVRGLVGDLRHEA
jgi:hypothetical protein